LKRDEINMKRKATLAIQRWVPAFWVLSLVFNAVLVFLLGWFLGISARTLVAPAIYTFSPSLPTGILLYWWHESSQEKKSRSLIFAVIISVHMLLYMLALDYSAVMVGYISKSTALRWIPYTFVGAVCMFWSALYQMSVRAKRRADDQPFASGFTEHP
jgi:hypothetical protein